MSQTLLQIEDLHVTVGETPILKGLTLQVPAGEVHALMGRNGSGKTTLSRTIMGHPAYKVTSGKILFNGDDITAVPVEERARRGLFLAFQHPVSLPGVTVGHFLSQAVRAVRGEMAPRDFRKELRAWAKPLKVSSKDLARYVNDGFSGGEAKRLETLQLALLRPKFALIDEIDSGLDVDALRIVAAGLGKMGELYGLGMLVITHYQRILDYITPDHVHILYDGRVVKSGGPELAQRVEATGYDEIITEVSA